MSWQTTLFFYVKLITFLKNTPILNEFYLFLYVAMFIYVAEKFGRLSEIVKIIAEICNMIKYGNYYGYESKYIYY